MYYFKENSLYCGNKILFKNIIPWVNTKIQPWDNNYKDLIYLNYVSSDEKSVHYESDGGQAKLTLTVKEQDNSFALFLEGGYDTYGLMGHGHHLNSLCGIGLDFNITHTGNYASGYMQYLFWQKPFVGSKLKDLKERTQMLLYKMKEDKVYLMSVCDKMFKTELFPCKNNRISLIAHSNTLCDDINECVLIGAYGSDHYILPERAAGFGLKVMNKAGKLKKDKKYPEIFEYLGWCSWDAFQHHITPDKVLAKCKEFKDKDIPVKWIILDDTWNDVTSIDNETKATRELNDWEAAPERFPDGLKKCVQDVKAQYDLKVGIWHPTSGYWYGINPNGPLAKRIPELLEYTIPGFYPDGPRLMHSFDKKKIEKYYDIQHKFYKDCGIDFTKVDNQGATQRHCYFKGGIGQCLSNLHNAIEKAAKKYYDGALINCMGMPVENLWNRTYSNVNRFSGDFMPEDRKWFVQHLLQCSYNTYSQGMINTGDWDMWWSDDEQAKKNSVLRAMSGGPIYVSDKLDRSIREVIMPTTFSDGRIIRLKDHCLPTEDCMFEDAENNGKIFKVFNTHNDAGILTAFNLDKDEKPVSGTVSPDDIYGIKKGEYLLYNWFSGDYQVISSGEKIDLTLENYDDFRLFLLVPIKNNKAVIGLKEKYMMPATYKKVKGGIQALDAGTLLVYENNFIKEIAVEKNQIYTV